MGLEEIIIILSTNIQINFITKIGTFFISILSGFGAIYGPFVFFNLIDHNSLFFYLVLKINKEQIE